MLMGNNIAVKSFLFCYFQYHQLLGVRAVHEHLATLPSYVVVINLQDYGGQALFFILQYLLARLMKICSKICENDKVIVMMANLSTCLSCPAKRDVTITTVPSIDATTRTCDCVNQNGNDSDISPWLLALPP
jgi:hypothetical protein